MQKTPLGVVVGNYRCANEEVTSRGKTRHVTRKLERGSGRVSIVTLRYLAPTLSSYEKDLNIILILSIDVRELGEEVSRVEVGSTFSVC